jgi:hypothetical protein
MAREASQYFHQLEKTLREFGDPMHYTQLSELLDIPPKNVATALAYHTRHFPLGTVRRVKRGTYLYVGSANSVRRRQQNIAAAIAETQKQRSGPVTQEEIDAKTHPAQQPGFVPDPLPRRNPVVEQLAAFGDELTPAERAAFREAAEAAADFARDTDLVRVEGYAPKSVVSPEPLRVSVPAQSERQFLAPGGRVTVTISHHQSNDDGSYDLYFVLNGKMWKAYQL